MSHHKMILSRQAPPFYDLCTYTLIKVGDGGTERIRPPLIPSRCQGARIKGKRSEGDPRDDPELAW